MQHTKTYHYFLLLTILNVAAFYLFIGNSSTGPLLKTEINYIIVTSIFTLSLWLWYLMIANRQYTRNSILIHLLYETACIIVIPILVDPAFPDRLYFVSPAENYGWLTQWFGYLKNLVVIRAMAWVAGICILLLLRKRTANQNIAVYDMGINSPL